MPNTIGNNSNVGMHDNEIRRGRCNDDHQNRKPDVAHRTARKLCCVCSVGIDVRLVPIARKTGGERVQRSAERSHSGGENPRQEQSSKSHRHLIENEVAECFVRGLG